MKKKKKTRLDLEKINFSIYLSITFSGILSSVFVVNWLFAYTFQRVYSLSTVVETIQKILET